MVRVGDHMTTITGCTTSAEVSRKIRDVVDSALSQGKDAMTELRTGGDDE